VVDSDNFNSSASDSRSGANCRVLKKEVWQDESGRQKEHIRDPRPFLQLRERD